MARAEGPEPPAAEPAPPGPVAVVAIGDGLVAGALPAELEGARSGAEAAGGGGWVPVLADCLEERAPQRFSVVDRAVAAETVASARQRVSGVRELAPGFVVLTLGAQELTASPSASVAGREPAVSAITADLKQLRGELDGLLGDLGRGRRAARPAVLLLSVVPANLAQAGSAIAAEALETHQREIDRQVAAWNEVLGQVAKGNDLASHVNLLADWPEQADARGALTEGGWALSAQGHARVAAAVCDAILGHSGTP